MTRSFFTRPTLTVARDLLGMKLSTLIDQQPTSGIITEVEGYHQDGDKASHSFRGKTARNASMFESGGHIYVYKIYGLHYCVNIVTEEAGVGAAVLIRAVCPLTGLAAMSERRNLVPSNRNLTNGPAKLCQAFGITTALDGEELLTSNRIFIAPYLTPPARAIRSTSRVGVTKSTSLPWRFLLDAEWEASNN